MDTWLGLAERFGVTAVAALGLYLWVRSLVKELRKDKLSCEVERQKLGTQLIESHKEFGKSMQDVAIKVVDSHNKVAQSVSKFSETIGRLPCNGPGWDGKTERRKYPPEHVEVERRRNREQEPEEDYEGE